MRKLGGSEFAALPDVTWRVDQQVPAILTTDQSCALIGQCEMSTGTGKKCPSQNKNSRSQSSRRKAQQLWRAALEIQLCR